jgi:peptide/nickel transport system ATP-binding protein
LTKPLLEVRDLAVSFETERGRARVLDGVTFQLNAGETLGLVGESGCGKSVTSLAITRLLPKPSGQIDQGQVLLDGVDLFSLSPAELRKIRGPRIGMVFQDAMTALNPVKRLHQQMAESISLHAPELSPKAVQDRSLELLNDVGIPSPELRLNDYPHQLSGGMRQRVMIAMALSAEPDLLIADEPTTALDVTVQAQILALIQRLQKERGMAVIFITHDLGVVAQICERVAVMYAGRIAEQGSVADLFSDPKHPYTRGLFYSIPHLDRQPLTELPTIEGLVPSPFDMPSGCRFSTRCPQVTERCKQPPALQFKQGRELACHEVSL